MLEFKYDIGGCEIKETVCYADKFELYSYLSNIVTTSKLADSFADLPELTVTFEDPDGYGESLYKKVIVVPRSYSVEAAINRILILLSSLGFLIEDKEEEAELVRQDVFSIFPPPITEEDEEDSLEWEPVDPEEVLVFPTEEQKTRFKALITKLQESTTSSSCDCSCGGCKELYLDSTGNSNAEETE